MFRALSPSFTSLKVVPGLASQAVTSSPARFSTRSAMLISWVDNLGLPERLERRIPADPQSCRADSLGLPVRTLLFKVANLGLPLRPLSFMRDICGLRINPPSLPVDNLGLPERLEARSLGNPLLFNLVRPRCELGRLPKPLARPLPNGE